MTVENKETVSDFDALMGEITNIAKAHSEAKEKSDTSEDDSMIEAAAEEADADKKKDHKEPDGDEKDGKEPKMVKKSLDATLADGSAATVVDADEIFKSISEIADRVTRTEAEGAARTESVLGGLKTLTDVVKSLADQVASYASTGRGRKAVLTVNDKPQQATEVVKSEPGVESDDFFAKALAMQSQGKLSGLDVQRAETYLNMGLPVPVDVVTKVLGTK